MLKISPDISQAIRSEAEAAYPEECCGAILGIIPASGEKLGRVIRPVVNRQADGSRHNRFLITAEAMLELEKYALSQGVDVLGFYHSHPDHPAKPSEFDQENALPFYSYVIIGVDRGVAGEMTCWELSPDRTNFHLEELVITTPTRQPGDS
ncbi:MAG: M67 family metallopeptidase [Planctomycetota bacterium]|jgi:proteasome lid subunit RPN8/RPN11|nr:M67 family metallopeptidase [Planctomycetota bacterium]